MQNPARKIVAAAATSALILGGSIAFGVSGFAADGPTTTTDATTTTAAPTTIAPPTTAAPTTAPPPTAGVVPGTIDPTTVAAGGTTHLTLPNLTPNDPVAITLAKGVLQQPPADAAPLMLSKTDANGLLDVMLTIPADTVPGVYTVFVQAQGQGGLHFYFKPITVTAKVQAPARVTPPAKAVPATPTFTG